MTAYQNSLKNLKRNALPEGTYEKVEYYLNNHPEMTPKEIYKKIGIGKTSFYKVKKKLEAEGRITSKTPIPLLSEPSEEDTKQTQELENSLKDSEDKNAKLSTEIENLKIQLSLLKKGKDCSNEIDKLKKENAKLIRQYNEVTKDKEAFQNIIGDVQSCIRQLKDDKDELKARIALLVDLFEASIVKTLLIACRPNDSELAKLNTLEDIELLKATSLDEELKNLIGICSVRARHARGEVEKQLEGRITNFVGKGK